MELKYYGNGRLHPKIRSNVIKNINGLDIHFLESGEKTEKSELIVLLHGFPELSFSWRKILPVLSDNGYHVIAPDQRGFGSTIGSDLSYTSNLANFSQINLATDIYVLVKKLGYDKVRCIVGHDSGVGPASWSSLIRPDVFTSLITMSGPFTGPPTLIDNSKDDYISETDEIDKDLAQLNIPRKHYQSYYRTESANNDIMNCKQGLKSFIRAYYHYKSADWKNNNPFELSSWNSHELSKMPTYYIMNKDQNMAETVNEHMPSDDEISDCRWLTENEIEVYVKEYSKTTFQGGLNWYRSGVDYENIQKLSLFSDFKIDVPSLFISGQNDWGIYQKPGALDKMSSVMSKFKGVQLVENAGHWVQQENPEKVNKLIIEFLSEN
ncbi:MAG: alpha/beta hydrolase [Chloroflexota bacterium]|jgi:pimeloyl-ACP methyl ester carboxylesterase|nr:alpha/beta hydrolase [Chloroflexota bacterium]